MHIRNNIIFLLDKKGEATSVPLRCRIRWASGRILAFAVGYSVDIAKWNTQTQRCVANTSHGKKRIPASTINRAIQTMEANILECFRFFETKGKIPTREELRDEYKHRAGIKNKKDKAQMLLLEVFDIFVQEQGRNNLWTKATHQKFATMRKHLMGFDRYLALDDLTNQTLHNFVAYLREDLDLRNSTIVKKISFLRWFLNWATAEGYNKNVAYKAFAPKMKNAERTIVFLEWEELMTLYELDLDQAENKTLREVRDVFCFCCFTSLRYSDVANLRRSNIQRNHLVLTTVKTSDSIRIDLNKYSRAILEKYAGTEYPNGLALPVISNQKMNQYLKELGKRAGLTSPITMTYYKGGVRHDETYPKSQLLTTHAARRTFICNALMMGIPPDIVMRWTGHSDYNAMKPYIAIADSAKQEAMSLFDKR